MCTWSIQIVLWVEHNFLFAAAIGFSPAGLEDAAME